MFRQIIFIITLVLILFCLGCANDLKTQETIIPRDSYEVQDARGKKFIFNTKPQKIISLYIYGDEILLGLVDHKRIAGLSKWVHDPDLSMASKEAEDVPKIAENNPEAILALKPDLVLLPSSSKTEHVKSLEDLGINVFIYPSASRLNNIQDTIRVMGNAVGETKQAEKIINEMQNRIVNIESKTKKILPEEKKKALLFLRFGAIGGKGIIFNDMLTAAGIEDCYNLGRSSKLDKEGVSRILSKEEVVRANPDYLILGSWNQGGAYKSANEQLEEIYEDPALSTITAVKKRQAIIIPQGYVNCLSHHAAESIEHLYESVYSK